MKLNFVYSQVYDEMLTTLCNKELDFKLRKKMLAFEKVWKKDEPKIIEEIEKVSGLKFSRDIDCYVVSHFNCRAISNPLTLKLEGTNDYKKYILVHELIHNLFVQNRGKLFPYIYSLYGDLDENVRVHFPLLLVCKKVISNFYGKRFLNRMIKKDDGCEFASLWPDALDHNFNESLMTYLKNGTLGR